MSDEGVNLHRHIGLAHLSKRATAFAGEGFDVENPAAWNQVRVLVVGAGGLGCELLHCLALSGFTEVEVIDMDTIDLSNLNRQFLFRHADIGKPKSEVAAAFITKRFPYMSVKPHFGKIQDMADDWYRSFHIIIMGLDSISARGWLNRKMASLIEYQRDEETGEITVASATPIIDGGTEGFRGSARHIKFGHTACVECSMYLYPPPMQIPMCTLENVPRVPEHCVLYVKEKTWEDHKPFGEQRNPETGKMEASPVDGDNQEHVLWIMGEAKKRQEHFKLEGDINFQFTQGVVKNVIPAVGFTNAMVAAMCTNEALKLAIGMSKLLDNYTFYDGGANGVASYAQFMGADPTCEVCQLPQNVTVPRDATPRVLFDAVLAHPKVATVLGAAATSAAEALLVATVRSPSGFRGEPTRILAPKSHPQFSLSEQYQSKPVLATLLSAANADDDDSEGAYVDLQVSGGTFRDVTLRFLVFTA